MTVLVTGAAGFIGSSLCKALLNSGESVLGIDNFNDYYSPILKKDRVASITVDSKNSSSAQNNFIFKELDIIDSKLLMKLFSEHKPKIVVNLAAQAGVRRSLEEPMLYIDSNITGFLNILEACRHHDVKHLVYASSSSVYGANTHMPFSVKRPADHPLSLYAATKRANELFAHSYSNLFGIPCTGLRFFTVYGPWGRPDMALFAFARAIVDGEVIKVYNHGQHKRDFTYIDDIVNGIMKVMSSAPQGNKFWNGNEPSYNDSYAPWRLYNIGNNKPISLLSYIEALENSLGIKAKKEFVPIQPGDVPATWADISELVDDYDYAPKTPIEIGINNFVTWFKQYYNI